MQNTNKNLKTLVSLRAAPQHKLVLYEKNTFMNLVVPHRSRRQVLLP